MKTLAYLTLFLAACSSNDGNQAITPEKNNEVSTVYELGACLPNRQSEVIFVSNEQNYYTCNNGNWEKPQTGIYHSSSSSFSNIFFASSSSQVTIDNNHIIDPRDGNIYRITTIGSQIWMAENLNYKTDNSICINDTSCTKYGRYYRFYTTNLDDNTIDMKYGYSEKDPCPSGWHTANVNDWITLFKTIGIIGSTDSDIQERTATLRAATSWEWTYSTLKDMPQKYRATDLYGFTILAAGWGREQNYNPRLVYFWDEGTKAVFWMGIGTGDCIKIDRDHGVIGMGKSYDSSELLPSYNSTYTWYNDIFNNPKCSTKAGVADALSIRCIKD